jgi:hypothetical protein
VEWSLDDSGEGGGRRKRSMKLKFGEDNKSFSQSGSSSSEEGGEGEEKSVLSKTLNFLGIRNDGEGWEKEMREREGGVEEGEGEKGGKEKEMFNSIKNAKTVADLAQFFQVNSFLYDFS